MALVVRILFVDNHPEFTSTVVTCFLAAHEVVVVPTIAAAKTAVRSASFEVLLVDFDLDDGKGDELVSWLRASNDARPIVAVSSHDAGNRALLDAGADVACSKLAFAQIQDVLENLAKRGGSA